MIKRLFNELLVLAALFISIPALAESNAVPIHTAVLPNTVSIPVVQPLPIDQKTPEFWLTTGKASLVGGEVTSSEQQFGYATKEGIFFFTSEVEYRNAVATEKLLSLTSPFLEVLADRPYVLPSTATFVRELSERYAEAGCGRLVVIDALRLISERPSNGSVHSVHPAGMAIDIRVRDIGEQCETWLNTYFLQKEAEGKVDATREYWKMVRGQKVPNPHFHIVVPLYPRRPNQSTVVATSVGAP